MKKIAALFVALIITASLMGCKKVDVKLSLPKNLIALRDRLDFNRLSEWDEIKLDRMQAQLRKEVNLQANLKTETLLNQNIIGTRHSRFFSVNYGKVTVDCPVPQDPENQRAGANFVNATGLKEFFYDRCIKKRHRYDKGSFIDDVCQNDLAYIKKESGKITEYAVYPKMPFRIVDKSGNSVTLEDPNTKEWQKAMNVCDQTAKSINTYLDKIDKAEEVKAEKARAEARRKDLIRKNKDCLTGPEDCGSHRYMTGQPPQDASGPTNLTNAGITGHVEGPFQPPTPDTDWHHVQPPIDPSRDRH